MKPLILLALIILTGSPLFCQPKTFSFVFLNSKPDALKLPKDELDKIMGGHMANINRLAKEGKLIAAGPFEAGGGIFILNTTSPEEAKQWLDTDPGIKAKRWDIEVFPYSPSVRSACAVKEPYQMVLYPFIRYKADKSPEGKKHSSEFIGNLQKDNIITAGSFGDTGEGIVVLKNKVEKELLEADEAVKGGHVHLDIKQLYIAKGSFCE